MSVQLLRQQAEWVIETSPVPPAEPPAPPMNSADVFAAIEARMAEVRADAAVATTAVEARMEEVRAQAAAGVAQAKAEAAAGVAQAKADAAVATTALEARVAKAEAKASRVDNAVVYPLARRRLLDEAREKLRMAAGRKDREVSTGAEVAPKWAKDYLSGQQKRPNDPGEPDEPGQPDQGGQAGQPDETGKLSLIMADLDIIFCPSEGSPRKEGNVAAHVFPEEVVEEAVLEVSPAVKPHRDSLKRIFLYVYNRSVVEKTSS